MFSKTKDFPKNKQLIIGQMQVRKVCMREQSKAKRDKTQQKEKRLSSPLAANRVSNATTPTSLKQSCWDAIIPPTTQSL